MNGSEQNAAALLEHFEEPTEKQRAYDALPVAGERLVLRFITGADAGVVLELHEACYVLGRGRCADIRVDGNTVSRAHARLSFQYERLIIEDLGSRNGTWVDGVRLASPTPLKDGQRICIGDTVMRVAQLDACELESARAMADAARKDPVTGCFNRASFDKRVQSEITRTRRCERCTALLMLDLDHFKNINDRYGHAAGDAALRAVGETLRQVVRGDDFVARYGGEEFVVILPGATCLGAALLAQRVRSAIEQLAVEFGTTWLKMTVSIGVACLERGNEVSTQGFIHAADEALYAAKREGRNRVHLGKVDGCVSEPSLADVMPTTITIVP